jgi:hypothetical protein
MGGAFDPKTRVIDCSGQQVTAKLNQVFRNPGTREYQYAQAHNTFDKVRENVPGNWQDLLNAYKTAGVDVGTEWAAWSFYLETLGTGPQGPQNISLIAQTRYSALTSNEGIDTITHGGGGPVRVTRGTIDSPCPP